MLVGVLGGLGGKGRSGCWVPGGRWGGFPGERGGGGLGLRSGDGFGGVGAETAVGGEGSGGE